MVAQTGRSPTRHASRTLGIHAVRSTTRASILTATPTHMPRVTPSMVDWWFWRHTLEAPRDKL